MRTPVHDKPQFGINAKSQKKKESKKPQTFLVYLHDKNSNIQ